MTSKSENTDREVEARLICESCGGWHKPGVTWEMCPHPPMTEPPPTSEEYSRAQKRSVVEQLVLAVAAHPVIFAVGCLAGFMLLTAFNLMRPTQ